ncbi:hypothetical protein [Azomonas macrocytogenes]|uniref:Uncharacterized protein n=1 Tax=Azomonas macrocytogenes TaxID=69962 RepID=A0A839T4H3_AZOMA|nr:hypothetical protein [Azomonas macrocytogenes]MBB3104437.1 hypothetical protein [Azomonas macrocytogenes]
MIDHSGIPSKEILRQNTVSEKKQKSVKQDTNVILDKEGTPCDTSGVPKETVIKSKK